MAWFRKKEEQLVSLEQLIEWAQEIPVEQWKVNEDFFCDQDRYSASLGGYTLDIMRHRFPFQHRSNRFVVSLEDSSCPWKTLACYGHDGLLFWGYVGDNRLREIVETVNSYQQERGERRERAYLEKAKKDLGLE